MKEEKFLKRIRRLEEESVLSPGWFQFKTNVLLGTGFIYFLTMGLILVALFVTLLTLLLVKPWVVLKVGLLLGSLIWMMFNAFRVKIEPPEGEPLDLANVPVLKREMQEMQAKLDSLEIHKVLITTDYNCSITQIPRYGLFGPQTNYLMLGLPMLTSLSPDSFRAVLAHELGHLSRSHGSYGTRVYRLRLVWSRLIEQLENEKHAGRYLFRPFLHWFTPRFLAYTFVYARKNEYEADRISATLTSPATAAAALSSIFVNGSILDRQFWHSIHEHAKMSVTPPDVYTGMKSFFRQPADAELSAEILRQSLGYETDYDDTHPSLSDRLNALGQTATLQSPGGLNAAEFFLGEMEQVLLDTFNKEWKDGVAQQWVSVYENNQENIGKLAVYQSRCEEELSPNQLWEFARLTEDLTGEKEAIPHYERLISRDPAFISAYVAYGVLVLRHGDEAAHSKAVSGLEHAIRQDRHCIPVACRALMTYYHAQQNDQQFGYYRKLWEDYETLQQAAALERHHIRAKDQFEPHGLPEHTRAALAATLKEHDGIREAVLVRKTRKVDVEDPIYVLLVNAKKPFLEEEHEFFKAFAQEIQNMDFMPDDVHVVFLKDQKAFKRVRRKAKKHPHAFLKRYPSFIERWNPVRLYRKWVTRLMLISGYKGKIATMKRWLSLGADPNLITDMYTPLALAGMEGNTEMMDVLYRHGANIEGIDGTGNVALFYSAYGNHQNAVQWLIDKGANLNHRAFSGRSQLSAVCMHGFSDLLRFMIQAGARPEFPCRHKGETPLMIACYNGNLSCVQVLLEAGVDVNVRAHNGYTALRFAVECEQQEIAACLRQHGAKM